MSISPTSDVGLEEEAHRSYRSYAELIKRRVFGTFLPYRLCAKQDGRVHKSHDPLGVGFGKADSPSSLRAVEAQKVLRAAQA